MPLFLLLLLLVRPAAYTPTAEAAQGGSAPAVPPGQAYRQTNIASDVPGLAAVQYPSLVNTWGMAVEPSFPLTVANNGTNTATLIDGSIPMEAPGFDLKVLGGPPTGMVVNQSRTDFLVASGSGSASAFLIFVSSAGDVAAYNGTDTNDAKVVLNMPGRNYTGLAIANDPFNSAPGQYLYAANFNSRQIDVFNSSFVLQTSGFTFNDPTVPLAYHPYNIQNLGNVLYVTYAKVGADGQPEKGPGLGYVRVFNVEGVPMPGGYSQKELNAPWGLAFAPSNFGSASSSLLVGNTGDGKILSINFNTGPSLLKDEAGQPIVIDGLRALGFLITPGSVATLYFTAGTAGGEHGLFGKLNPTTATATSLIEFATDNFSVSEAGKFVDFTVVRNGDTSGTATVNYNTFDESEAGHASQKSDYEISLGTLSFAAGETSKTFRILIVDDNFVEGDETISLALSNPTGTGVGLGSPNTAEVTILDNDTVASTSNPIDDSNFFVRQHYLDFLNREPDTAGLNFWVNQITSCGTGTAAAQCREVRRINVSAAFFLSIEFRNTGLLAYLTNKAAFGPNAPGSPAPVLYGQFERDIQQLQQNFVFGQAGADAQLEANKQAYFAYTVRRPDFISRHPTTNTDSFVTLLFLDAGFTPTAAERQAVIDEFGGAADATDLAARARALRRVAESPTFAGLEFNRAFVTMEYFGYLRRDPDTAGFNFWLNKLNSFSGDFIKAEMVKAFIASSEYRQRFGAN